MVYHLDLEDQVLLNLIKAQKIKLGGNRKMKIYGNLSCKSGMRMKKENRVFFEDETEAETYGYRPCGNCMSEQYRKHKKRPKS